MVSSEKYVYIMEMDCYFALCLIYLTVYTKSEHFMNSSAEYYPDAVLFLDTGNELIQFKKNHLHSKTKIKKWSSYGY
jgi:hypothetical protein